MVVIHTGDQCLEKAVSHIVDGLTTDGAHHKQWHLEQALRQLIDNRLVDMAKKKMGWEEGIPS